MCVLEAIDFVSYYDFDFAIFPIVWNFILFFFFNFICTILFQSFLIWSYGQKSVVMILISKESLNSTWLWSNHVLFKLAFGCIDWIFSNPTRLLGIVLWGFICILTCLFLESYAILHERFIHTYRCCLFGSIVCKMSKYLKYQPY
jgi:hypothetical protein